MSNLLVYDTTAYQKIHKKPKFKPGDIVRFKNGGKPITVLRCEGQWLDGKYMLSGQEIFSRSVEHFVEWTDRDKQALEILTQDADEILTQGETENMATLYEVEHMGIIKFAIKLAVNSQGRWVMEEKGTNVVFTADKDKVTEVTPYTIGVCFLGGATVYSYFATAGQFKVGDTFIVKGIAGDPAITTVMALDTKSKQATKEFAPIIITKLVTEDFK